MRPTHEGVIVQSLIIHNPSGVNRTEILPGISDHDSILCKLDISPSKITQYSRKPTV